MKIAIAYTLGFAWCVVLVLRAVRSGRYIQAVP